jgi:hypothetical protein
MGEQRRIWLLRLANLALIGIAAKRVNTSRRRAIVATAGAAAMYRLPIPGAVGRPGVVLPGQVATGAAVEVAVQRACS